MPADRTATRRDFLRSAAAGAAGLSLPASASGGRQPPVSGTAKSCIFINLVGGPSHLDTFDPKPDAASDVRGPFRPIHTRVPGLHLSGLFPKLAAVADKFALIRGMHHDGPPVHEVGLQLLNTGRLFRDGPEWPNVGAALAHLAGEPSGPLPRCSVLPHRLDDLGIPVGHGQGAGWLSPWYCHPLCTGGFHQPMSVWFPRAAGFVTGGTQQFVTVNTHRGVFGRSSWDCHAAGGSLGTTLDDYRETVAPSFDAAFASLLTDLSDRGLLDSTLVVATGEFGRTPYLNGNGGRDHWAGCWTALVAGGGVRGGQVLGASDRLGGEPKDRPVTPQELVSTVFHALGVPADATIPDPAGSPVPVYPGRPVPELF